METLNNYITERIIIAERIRVDNIKPKFPVDGTAGDIIDFLEEHGFNEIKYLPNLPNYTDYTILFNKYENKCFGIEVEGANNMIIYFANTSDDKISKSNILYIIRTSPRIYECGKIWGDDIEMCTFLDKSEFKKEMESYF